MATGLSSNQIKVGDYVRVVDGYVADILQERYGYLSTGEVLEKRENLLRIQFRQGCIYLAYSQVMLIRSALIKISIDDQGNFDTSDLSKDDITIIQRYINELSK